MTTDVMTPARSTALLARANPLSKLFAAAVISIALLLSVDVVSAGTALVLELLVLPLAGVNVRLLLVRGWPILVAALVGAYGSALLSAKTGSVVFELGPVVFTTGSLLVGVAMALRTLAIALPGIMVLACTDPSDLADALAQKLRLPHRFVLGALAAMRLVGLLLEEWQTLGLARRARGVGATGGPIGRIKGFLGQALALLVQAIRRASQLATTMEAKGFSEHRRTWARKSTFTPLDAVVAGAGLVATAVVVCAAVVLGTWHFAMG
ncbi:MAG: energy-coupling factor transporter transmembrane protein EcfT [Acidobacteria bacterium]|nr:energy-coupling factor transporter transmembrane protein EcfT [Acidobacteriota bacterium]